MKKALATARSSRSARRRGARDPRPARDDLSGLQLLINVTVKDTEAILSRSVAKRGWLAHFVITNKGTKTHVFDIGGLKTTPMAPGQKRKLGAFLDDRGQFKYKVDGKVHGYLPSSSSHRSGSPRARVWALCLTASRAQTGPSRRRPPGHARRRLRDHVEQRRRAARPLALPADAGSPSAPSPPRPSSSARPSTCRT